MLVAKSWDEMTDEEILIEMDDFGDSHTTIHEAAKRIRAKNARIAALEADLATAREHADGLAEELRNMRFILRITARKLARQDGEAEWQDALPTEFREVYMTAGNILRAHNALRAAQPEPEAGAS